MVYMEYKDTVIQNISDYLIWVEETHKADVIGDDEGPICFENNHAYYRGHSCLCWELKPSVLRDPYINEHALLKKASLRLYNETSFLNSYLEKMIFFQHYGLTTRLLDVTFNPLVSLYMACYEENMHSCDGVVFSGLCSGCQNQKIAELTAKYIFENELQQEIYGSDDFFKNEGYDIKCFIEPIFILPPINNPRIEAQNGAFIMAPLISRMKDSDIGTTNKSGLESTQFFEKKRAIIKGYNKESIIHELSILGIDSGTIYRGVESKLKAIVTEEKYKSNHIKNIQI